MEKNVKNPKAIEQKEMRWRRMQIKYFWAVCVGPKLIYEFVKIIILRATRVFGHIWLNYWRFIHFLWSLNFTQGNWTQKIQRQTVKGFHYQRSSYDFSYFLSGFKKIDRHAIRVDTAPQMRNQFRPTNIIILCTQKLMQSRWKLDNFWLLSNVLHVLFK